MSGKTVEIYKSYTAIIALEAAETLAPTADIERLVEGIGGVLVGHFGDSMVGYAHDPTHHCIYATFKRYGDAIKVVDDWGAVMEVVQAGMVDP